MGYSCLCVGALDLGALDDAFGELQRQYPLLRSVIRESGSGFEFATGALSRARVFSGEDQHAQVTGLGAEFDQTDRLAYLDIIPGDGDTRVTLFVHHSAADGRHALALLQELWGRYTQRVETGEPQPVRPEPFPLPLEHYLDTREHPGAELSLGLDELPSAGSPQVDWAEGRVRSNAMLPARAQLSRDETQSLIDLGHDAGVTVNALVSAALIRAHACEDAPLPLYVYMVDLRGRVVPPVGLTEVTNMIRSIAFSADGHDDGLFALARRIGDQLAAATADGTVHTGAAELPLFGPQPGKVLHSTNWGRILLPRTPSDLRIVDFQSCFPPFPPPPAADDQAVGEETQIYVILTFEGRLSVETLADERTRAVLGRVGEELRAAARAHVG
ncbi:phthiocerol/phthiodiolone dimycocerosyl transferase family protein [Segniliparus rugosus]|uniref:Phthiocerol/phthiodiolone dimycocerosyl transferase n=1 Tax=Segniliparus rugosus (strain ATCC BAA-974 / DSM 45345 / CCUG 50838 / CIP 108380 / JCM 13579 / CDC 945) TaxID=679197 RepID=E5XN40_SEGRC|nr:hypothetical protein [Segniliparus rugosus]EFV14234.2 hypothetical protein HMPREF9336_00910 [Segniliparus rugosus ATCC BAA-974]